MKRNVPRYYDGGDPDRQPLSVFYHLRNVPKILSGEMAVNWFAIDFSIYSIVFSLFLLSAILEKGLYDSGSVSVLILISAHGGYGVFKYLRRRFWE